MGITGLIPFLEKASSSVNIRQLQGSSVAVDSYCWLHKGVFACAEKLIRGETTDIHIQYCLKYVDMLMRHKIKVIMVFDGRHLPAKAETERRRREARNESKELAKEYLRRNEIEKARSHMRRAVDVTHEMALQLIKECRQRGVDCIVAPYEADAQMAWLNKQGLAEYIVTEDSDLTLFGAKKILFKLDLTGQALLVENTKLHLAMGCKLEKYTFDKFRRMCILSGCDYLDSLQGIGLKKACKFILTTEEDDMTKALKKIPTYLKMKQLEVTDDYIESFLKAEATFKHMFVYNPLERRMERLHELEEFQTDESHCSNAGSLLDDAEQAFQLALGNLNPFSLKQLDDWHPDRSWSDAKTKLKSIWRGTNHADDYKDAIEHKPQVKKATGSIFQFKKIEYKNMAEMEIQEKLIEEKCKLEEAEIFSMYKYASPKMDRKRKRRESTSSSSEAEEDNEKHMQNEKTPKKYAHNPFAKVNTTLENIQKSPVCNNNSLLKLLSPKKANDNNINQQKASVKSRFFAENIKQVVKKPFAARDLTSEMFKIEKKTNAFIEQQQDLYHCSMQSPKKKIIDNKPTKIEDEDESLQSSSQNNNNNEEEDEEDNYNKESLESSESCPSSQENKPCGSSVTKEEIILLSDIEEEEVCTKKSSTKVVQKLTMTFSQRPHVGLSKTKAKTQTTPRKSAKSLTTVDPKQSKLSMFGFQKRPSLKKL
ncbi:exonuclease 1 [Lucilia sericata]|uniref:exonuclease 1 n=1 Tax=Lucilia sericata TaxID=13632 RepID=UPI0018A80CB9|nr:exonuclease 1 [Lucilia sericata]